MPFTGETLRIVFPYSLILAAIGLIESLRVLITALVGLMLMRNCAMPSLFMAVLSQPWVQKTEAAREMLALPA